jgi:sterol-4alpha-carboxylate 3-dehydrogenase (decarboxylating)
MLMKALGTTHILVTGGAGFVGSAIVSAIVEKHPDWRVTIVDIKPEETWQAPISSARIDYLQADIRVPNECYNAVELTEPDCIV